MYLAESLRKVRGAWRSGGGARVPVGRNVVFLGLTSLITDVSSEMVAAVLPLYLVYTLEMSPLVLGAVDGIYQGAAVLVRVATGLVADRWRRLKEAAGAGYALSVLCKLGFIAAGSSAGAIAVVVAADRTGKGMRAAPRDALIALSAPPAALGAAFGVHRLLDTVGAMLGPLLAFALLGLVPGRFDAIFVVSFCVGLVGLAVFAFFVDTPARSGTSSARRAVSVADAAGLLRLPRFRALLAASTVLAATTLGDGLLYLVVQQRSGLDKEWLPLCWVWAGLWYALLALPFGRLADRLGRERVFIGGYLLLAAAYALLLGGARDLAGAAVVVALLGATYAATDGVLMAAVAPVLPESLRATGMAMIGTATGLARLVASLLFGALWTWWGREQAVAVFLAGVLAATAAAAWLAGRRQPEMAT
jgi:MFS family permease